MNFFQFRNTNNAIGKNNYTQTRNYVKIFHKDDWKSADKDKIIVQISETFQLDLNFLLQLALLNGITDNSMKKGAWIMFSFCYCNQK